MENKLIFALLLFATSLFAQLGQPVPVASSGAPTKVPLPALAIPATSTGAAIVGVLVVTADGYQIAKPGNVMLHIDRQADGSYTISADAVSVRVMPHFVVGQILPSVGGILQLVAANSVIVAPVIYRNGIRLTAGRDFTLDPVPQAPGLAEIFNVRLLPGVAPLSDSDLFIADYSW
jgi:hypothetical protein